MHARPLKDLDGTAMLCTPITVTSGARSWFGEEGRPWNHLSVMSHDVFVDEIVPPGHQAPFYEREIQRNRIQYAFFFFVLHWLHDCAAVFSLARGHNNHVLVPRARARAPRIHTVSSSALQVRVDFFFSLNWAMWQPSVLKKPHIFWCKLGIYQA